MFIFVCWQCSFHIEPAEVEYRAVSSLPFRDHEQSSVEVSFEKGIAFIAPIDWNLFTSASTSEL